MKEAGLTHGGFYAHFPSREAMLVEAADRASAESAAASARVAASAPRGKALGALVRRYLSKAHVDNAEHGCPVAALASEMPRQPRQLRKAATRHIRDMIDVVARQMPGWGTADAHERALVTVATMVGAVELARAVDDPKLAAAFRAAALKYLVQEGD